MSQKRTHVIACADAWLKDAGQPTYTELLQKVESMNATAAQPLDLDKLSGDIMNIRCDDEAASQGYPDQRYAYKAGHRDARHVAAELVNEQAAQVRTARLDTTASAPQEPIRAYTFEADKGLIEIQAQGAADTTASASGERGCHWKDCPHGAECEHVPQPLQAGDAVDLLESLELAATWIGNITPEQLELWRESKVAEIRRDIRKASQLEARNTNGALRAVQKLYDDWQSGKTQGSTDYAEGLSQAMSAILTGRATLAPVAAQQADKDAHITLLQNTVDHLNVELEETRSYAAHPRAAKDDFKALITEVADGLGIEPSAEVMAAASKLDAAAKAPAAQAVTLEDAANDFLECVHQVQSEVEWEAASADTLTRYDRVRSRLQKALAASPASTPEASQQSHHAAATTSEDARDAARYRWLRDKARDAAEAAPIVVMMDWRGEIVRDVADDGLRSDGQLDETMDHAMRATQQEGK